MSKPERKFANLGELAIKESKNEAGGFEPEFVEVDGEKLQKYTMKVYIPDDVDEAGIGEPSIVLKKDQYVEGRALSSKEIGKLPEFLRDKVAVKLGVSLNRKQYPKKGK